MSDIAQQIQEYIASRPVVLFMKGTKDFPQCGFSSGVAQALTHLNIDFLDVNVLESDVMRQGIKDFSNWPTIPQIYIKGEFIGGFDIFKEMYETGELFDMLDQKAVDYRRPAASQA